jgi:hypothetical protein
VCLDKFVVVTQRHLNYIKSEFQVHYNRERPHEAVGTLPPARSMEPSRTSKEVDEVYSSRLGGALVSYSLRAA